MTVLWGVRSDGVPGPKTAIELGQNTRSIRWVRASSSTFSSPPTFRFQVRVGSFSPLADNIAAR